MATSPARFAAAGLFVMNNEIKIAEALAEILNRLKRIERKLAERREPTRSIAIHEEPKTNPRMITHETKSRAMKPRSIEDLKTAITLRPSEVERLCGVSRKTVSQWCLHPDPAERLPSIKKCGRSGRKGARLIMRTALEAFLERSRQP